MAKKNIAGRASFLVVKFLLFVTKILPVRMIYAFSAFVVFVGSRLRWKRKRIALDNIKIVFPEKTDKERKYIFRESLRNMLKNYFEIAFVINGRYGTEEISQMAGASGLEYLDELKARNQGALIYSGHFGNFGLLIAWLAIKGYPLAAIYKEAANFPDDFFEKVWRKLNVTPLKYKSDAALTVSIIRALKDGKFVFIQNDQSHPQGIYINFFNKSVPSPAGPALLAKRVGVPIIPAFICRDRNNNHQITILPEIRLKEEGELEKYMLVNTQLLLDWIAEILLKHPTEWLWLHNRWKRAR
jgi:Kdo2-lipid IVA lauroyltransferase/acyltransferase